ncbi:DoxX family protein [Asanoa sp. WMMD1127]|uniref:DoxX family protein n=1 Tax=Asanoa sp. WMMD1127 TaxID=3016107 RepID=UPI002416EB05|nr:DoxX family protein [Asanoa sp. WMMD1127]MDG4827658.1 DoxX family protein [Asanoa sp. WMMD1127]
MLVLDPPADLTEARWVTSTYVAVTAIAAAANAAAATMDFARPRWILTNMTRYKVPHSWLPLLGTAKAAGAAGLLVGLAAPAIGALSAGCLVAYFGGAVVTVVRARCWSHLPSPLFFLALAAAPLVLTARAS